MDLPRHEHKRRGEDGLSLRTIARKDMGFKYGGIQGGPTYLDHFFPNDGEACKFSLQVKRDLYYLNLLNELYPIY